MAQAPTLLSELAIRTALVMNLRSRLQGGEVLVEELGVEHGAARIDVALVSNHLIGFEIKSDFDNLDRLARQMHTYHRIFDSLTIVTTMAYSAQVEALLPRWWGIFLAAPSEDGGVVLTEIRPAMIHNRQDPVSLAGLLWRDEAYGFLVAEGGAVVKAKAARHTIYEAIAKAIPLERIRAEVTATLRSRMSLRPRSHMAS